MRVVLGLLALGVCAQATLSEVEIPYATVGPVNEENDYRVIFTNVLEEATVAGNVPQFDVVLEIDEGLRAAGVLEHPGHRKLGFVRALVRIWKAVKNALLSLTITVKLANGVELKYDGSIQTDSEGKGKISVNFDERALNEALNGLCEGCTLTVENKECTASQRCDAEVNGKIVGDPHMVGLLGQKIDWAGVDNAWYCLMNDGPDLHVNVRLSAPMPEEFPDRQLISAVSVLSDDGRSSLVVEVKNPYTTNTDGCPDSSSFSCLADGGLRILVDGEESTALQAPAVNVRLPGRSPVVVSAANLPAECRPFGGDRIWATQVDEMMTKHRRLRSDSVSLGEWILQPDTLAAPTWCAKYLEERGPAGILTTRSEHATMRVETPKFSVRINVGVNYQDLETAPDGTVLVPELEFWQTDLEFDGLQVSLNVGGLMGDTSRYVRDDEGVPVTNGIGALHGAVESYRVAGPFARDFEKLHG